MAPSDDADPMSQWSDSLAEAWERHRDRVFEMQRPVSDWLVDRIQPSPGDTVVELAAGPGETGFLVAERVGASGRVISTDLGEGMVAAARRGAAGRGLDNVEARVMDAQEIDLDDASVDGALCRFGIMLMPRPELALSGVRRALRPGGRFAYAVWGAPEANPWFTSLGMGIVSTGHQPPGDPFGAGGPFSLADPARNEELLGAAGLTLEDQEQLLGTMTFDDFDGYWDLQTQIAGPLALLMASLPASDVQEIRAAVEPLVEPFESGGGYEFPTDARVFAASAP